MSSESERLKMKRKCKSVELHVKLEALKEIEQGISKELVASKLGVGVSTVRGWLKKEEALKQFQAEHENIPKFKKRIKRPDHESVDKAVWLWYQEQEAAGGDVSGSALRAQAMEFWESLDGKTPFTASKGWLEGWQRRHGVKFETPPRKAPTPKDTSIEDFKAKFAEIIETENLMPDQVFNCSDTSLKYRQLPKVRRTIRYENTFECRLQQERVTLMACSNASGSLKLPLVLIDKHPRPQALQNIVYLPVSYKEEGNAWMTCDLFEEWFIEEFVPSVKEFLKSRQLPQKAVLFVDDSAAHPAHLEEDGIRVEFIPANTNAVLQPMDQGCLHSIKVVYRQQLMSFVMDCFFKGELYEVLKDINIRCVVEWIANAWENVTTATIVQSWEPLWPNIRELLAHTFDVNAQGPSTVLFSRNEEALFTQFQILLQRTRWYPDITADKIKDWLYALTADDEGKKNEPIMVIVQEANDEESCKEEDRLPEKSTMTLEKAQTSLDDLIEFCAASSFYSKEQILDLVRIRESVKIHSLVPQTLKPEY